jgi:hypothetical protein
MSTLSEQFCPSTQEKAVKTACMGKAAVSLPVIPGALFRWRVPGNDCIRDLGESRTGPHVVAKKETPCPVAESYPGRLIRSPILGSFKHGATVSGPLFALPACRPPCAKSHSLSPIKLAAPPHLVEGCMYVICRLAFGWPMRGSGKVKLSS